MMLNKMREELKNISRLGKWNDSVDNLNFNFRLLGENLSDFTKRADRCKGLFSSYSRLSELYPNPGEGTWALVGEEFPAEIYIFNVNSGNWIPTGQFAGDEEFEFKQLLANSIELDFPPEFLFKPRATWIYKDNHNGKWKTYENGIKLIDPDDATYTVRLKSLRIGEGKELLEQTITDPYLWEFNIGQTEHFTSMKVMSNDNITETFTEPYLSWTIDSSYYRRVINNKLYERVPVNGDIFRTSMKFVDSEGEDRILSNTFCFIL